MGFSVSGTAAIIFAAMFLSFGIIFGAADNSFERVSEAQESQADAVLAAQNTAINVTLVEHVGDRLTILVDNNGTTTLSLNHTDVLIDNAYEANWQSDAQVDGDGSTFLWQPGQELNVTVTRDTAPSRVKIVTETGIADTGTEVR